MAATWAGKIPVTQVNQTTKTFTASVSAETEEYVDITTEPDTGVQAVLVRITLNENARLPVKKGTIVRVVVQVTDEEPPNNETVQPVEAAPAQVAPDPELDSPKVQLTRDVVQGSVPTKDHHE